MIKQRLAQVLVVVVLTTLGLRGVSLAAAPTATPSYYMTNMTGTDQTDLDNWEWTGCSDGQAGKTGFVILDFGGQQKDSVKGWGAKNWNGVFQTRSDIAAAVRGYIQGFWNCTPGYTQKLRVGIGTNNSLTVSTAAGQNWAYMVNDVNQWVVDTGKTQQITVWGANDIEIGWGLPTPAIAWADGYSGAASVYYAHYGDAEGCPETGTVQGWDGQCRAKNGNTWLQSGVWYVSWGAPKAYPLPEIYNTAGAQAKQWQQISLYGYLNKSGRKLVFQGAMTQYAACQQKIKSDPKACVGTDNTAAAGWQQLYDEINKDTRTTLSSLPYSTDIVYAKYP